MEEYVVVIGGLNMDIAGLPGTNYVIKDSNPGKIQMSPGGVGRNISHNLVNLDIPTYLISMYGDDELGESLERSCEELNIRLDYAEKLKDQNTSTYMYITDDRGDMVAAVNDMNIINEMTPGVLKNKIEFLNNTKLCVLDANLPKETIEWVCERVKVPIFADPVSVAKAEKFTNVLAKLDTIKPNQMEAELYTGIKIIDDASAKLAVKKLIDLGVDNVYITLGEKGMVCGSRKEIVLVPRPTSPIVSTNGAGDATTATIVWCSMKYNHSLSIEEVSKIAQAAASITIGDEKSVSESLTPENIENIVKKFYMEN